MFPKLLFQYFCSNWVVFSGLFALMAPCSLNEITSDGCNLKEVSVIKIFLLFLT